MMAKRGLLRAGIATECAGQIRCRELANSSSFCRKLYSEIEEVGWEHLVRLDDNLTFLSFRVLDASGRVHVMEVQVDKTYPQCPPSISGDVPYIPKIEWSATSRLKDAVIQFKKHVDTLEDFWSTLDDIDNSLWVVNPNFPCRAMCHRLVNIGCKKNLFEIIWSVFLGLSYQSPQIQRRMSSNWNVESVMLSIFPLRTNLEPRVDAQRTTSVIMRTAEELFMVFV
ncbi:E3 ubiquitin-protein ligase FANCL isoform X6 [Rhodamnia argentea]|uniref:E3 ubiquitin-protein ligase FANCL isoform X6 n=1 Tax=Rhodamnia argentea TaxID=178133 RepID=A0ABM3H2E0_9MYRT|nr:E3 ubiquitin-protein ligase FANCL isoform X6 [Rhodamnia argentea]